MEPATAGDRNLQATLSPVITGLNHDLRLPWGSRPRLYAYACFAGWAIYLLVTAIAVDTTGRKHNQDYFTN